MSRLPTVTSAELNITLNAAGSIVGPDAGLWAGLRSGLSTSVRGLAYSLENRMGKGCSRLIEGLPAGVVIDPGVHRQRTSSTSRRIRPRTAGRKLRRIMAEFLVGVRMGKTIGSPVAILVAEQGFAARRSGGDTAAASAEAGTCGFGGVGQMADNRLPAGAGASECPRNCGTRGGWARAARCFLREFGIEVFRLRAVGRAGRGKI